MDEARPVEGSVGQKGESMRPTHLRFRLRLLTSVAATVLILVAQQASAQDAAGQRPAPSPDQDDDQVEQVVITGQKSAVPANVPNVLETVTAEHIQETVNAATSAEALKYVPSIEVRERFIGDRNAMLATRTTGVQYSAQSMVYADDILMSNFLGNGSSYAPRWGMVSPEEIEQADVMYGPYSALYPGNSMGGAVVMRTHMPEKAEAHATAQTFHQHYKLYGTDEGYDGYHAAASVGDKIDKLSVWLGADHLKNESQPTQFSNATSKATGSGTYTPVTGAYSDGGQTGGKRVIFGATSIDDTTQDNLKLKLAYDITPAVKATYTLGFWQADTDSDVDSYLRTASGAALYNGNVSVNGDHYKVSMNPSHTDALHAVNALSLKSDTKGVWDWEASASLYSFLENTTRSATNYGNNSAGTVQYQDGSGWGTGDLRGIWRPTTDLAGKHEVAFGYHFDQYQLNQTTFTTNNWYTENLTGLQGVSTGSTRTQALYAQDAWAFHPDWKLTFGGRGERWEAFDGTNKNATSTAIYDDQQTTKFSPKASLAYQMTPALSHTASVGRAFRFPTVTELYQAITSGNALVQNNPNLKPEKVLAYDWTSEYAIDPKSKVRMSVFEQDSNDALISQQDSTSTLTYFQNVDKTRVRGAEMAYEARDFLVDGLDFNSGLTYTSSRILADASHPSAVGNEVPSIPRWRARMSALYHQNENLSYAASLRWQDHILANIDNNDVNRETYGGKSDYLITDIRANYKLNDQWRLAAGIDNLFNQKYFTSHPYPERTFFAEVSLDY